MVMSTTEPRETLSTDVGPDEDAVVTAAVVHLMQTYRVISTCGTARSRLVWDGVPPPTGCP